MASDLIKRDSIRADIAVYMSANAYLNDTALDVLKMIDKWLCEMEAVDAVEVVRCEACAYSKREGNALRCPYSTVDLDPKGYCSRGIQIAMAAKAPLDEHVKKAITEGEWGDQA